MSANWFIALPVSAEPWFYSLGNTPCAPPPAVQLFHPADLHLTVAFLGAVAESAARAAFVHAQSFALAPIAVELGPVQALGARQRPSALSATLAPGAARDCVAAAMAGIREVMWNAAKARPDSRPPLPHVTLARPKRDCNRSELHQALRWAAELPVCGTRIWLDRIALYTSAKDPGAQKFQQIETRQLRAS